MNKPEGAAGRRHVTGRQLRADARELRHGLLQRRQRGVLEPLGPSELLLRGDLRFEPALAVLLGLADQILVVIVRQECQGCRWQP
jgi:hypothetical protein